MNETIKHRLAAVCQDLAEGDGCDCTYAHVAINKVLGTVAASYRRGADGSYKTVSLVIGPDSFVGAVVVQPDALYSPEPEVYRIDTFEEYIELFAGDDSPEDASWEELLMLFHEIEIVEADVSRSRPPDTALR